MAGVRQAFDEVTVNERTSVEIIVEEETGEIGAQDEAVSTSQGGNAGPNRKSGLTNASSAPLLASQPEKRAIAEPAAGHEDAATTRGSLPSRLWPLPS